MLRHAGALRPCLRHWPIGARNRASYPSALLRTAASPLGARSQLCNTQPDGVVVYPAGALICAQLHHDARHRRVGNTKPAFSMSKPLLVSDGLAFGEGGTLASWGTLAHGVGPRRTIFSGGEEEGLFGKWFGAGQGAKSKMKDTVDEETRTSIRRGDDKTKRSMKTVKVGGGLCRRL